MCNYENVQGEQRNLIRDLFEIRFEVTLQNQEILDEQAKISFETNRKLMCIIDNESNPVNTLIDGIRVVSYIPGHTNSRV
jgi:ubiquitin carboxyl-terminal hydrolase 14